MTMTDIVRVHQARCVPHLARLRMLAAAQTGTPFPPGVVSGVAAAVGAVVAEAIAAERDMAAASGGRDTGADQPLLAARLHRLHRAARDAMASARNGNPAILRDRVHRFDTMTSAMWTVHLSVVERNRPRRRGGPLPAGSAGGGI